MTDMTRRRFLFCAASAAAIWHLAALPIITVHHYVITFDPDNIAKVPGQSVWTYKGSTITISEIPAPE